MNSIRSIFDGVISRGGYDLTGMLARVDEYHVAGRLTDEERDALYQEARARAACVRRAGRDRGPVGGSPRVADAAVRAGRACGRMARVRAADRRARRIPGCDKVTYNGGHYICKLANCVWPPDAYPAGWEEQQ